MLLGAPELLLDRTPLGALRRSTLSSTLLPVMPRAQGTQVPHAVIIARLDVVHVGRNLDAARTRLVQRGALPCVSAQNP
ncbi:hypothetical protein ACOB87_38010 [Streptomyces sp. YS-B37]|uniref:hypothetical protein n=1 Tax=Streptomyces sp. YS-B37 TaxID=3407669 RepID=UPI003B504A3E